MRAIARKLSQQILEFDLGSVLGAETREAIAATASAVPAAHADDHIRVEGEPIARHSRILDEQNANINAASCGYHRQKAITSL